MKKLLVVVDMQNDFVRGTLGSADAVAILPNVIKKLRFARENGVQSPLQEIRILKIIRARRKAKNYPSYTASRTRMVGK